MTDAGEQGDVEPRLDEHAPAGFAAVMATGIVSIAAHLLDVAVVAVALFAINVAAYLALWLLLGLRIARDPRALARELADHRRGGGFLAIVAGTCTLGAQTELIAGGLAVATALLILGAVLWIVLLYAFLAALMVRPEKPAGGIDGGWLLAVVATESIAVLIALLAVHWHAPLRRDADFVAVSLWLSGGMLYVWLVALVVHRLAVLFAWRHAVHGVPLRYHPLHWGAVFPLGMYAVATLEMDRAMALGFLDVIAHVAFWIALTAWLATFAGLVRAALLTPRTAGRR